MSVLHLPSSVRDDVVGMARAGLPNEVCGLLSGSSIANADGDESWVVSAMWPISNSLASPVDFALDGEEMLEAERRIDEAGEAVIGVVHSHPTTEAHPSRRDIDDAAHYDPYRVLVHVIVSLQGFAPVIRAWRMPAHRSGATVELDVVAGDLPFD